jgi:pimeloyl-ACP methyl ester carboxylesterase
MSDAIEAARRAEQAVWAHHDLPIKEGFVSVGDGRLRVRWLESGNPSGTPIVFVQGGLGEGLGWASLMARLREFRCITLDRPGSGFSDGVDFMKVDVRKLAVDTLSAVLGATAIDRAAFVANSMGGWWCFQLAADRPSRVSKLVLLGCPAVLVGTSAPLPMRLMSLPVLGNGLVSAMVPENTERARATPTFLGHPKEVGERWPEVQAEAFYRLGHLPNFRQSWLTLVRRFLRLSGANPEMRIVADQLRKVTAPTLFLWGSKDPFGTPDAGRAAARVMPNARLEVVGIGHLPWWDDPDSCARHTRDFLTAAS